ncbi:MAG: DUF1971 domain-containing protein [Acidimicrobiales bacterium]
MPSGLRRLWSTPEWDERSAPPGLMRAHFVLPGTWGQIVMHDGRLGLVAHTTPMIDVVLRAGAVQALPPDIEHQFHLVGSVRFALQFFAIDRGVDVFGGPTSQRGQHDSGEHGGGNESLLHLPHLVCPECGISSRDCWHG